MTRSLAVAALAAAALIAAPAASPPSADAAVVRGGIAVNTGNVVKVGPFLFVTSRITVAPGWRAAVNVTLYRGATATSPSVPIAASAVRTIPLRRRAQAVSIRVSSVCEPGSPGYWFGLTRVAAQRGTRGPVIRFGARSSASLRLSCGRV